jgi:predicted MFS family arabinose efflux permease
MRGRAYGFHRAMDHAGAALGTLLGAGLLLLIGASTAERASAEQLRSVFLWSALPGALAMLALALMREPPQPAREAPQLAAAGPLPAPLKRALLPIGLFAFANASDAFVLVMAARLGASPLLGPAIWLLLHIVKASTATAGGRLADRYGRRNSLALGWGVYALTWSTLGFAQNSRQLVLLASLYGTSHGLVEGAEKALIAELAPPEAKGKAFGVYNMLSGVSALLASTGFGWIWDHFGSPIAFASSGALALLAALLMRAQK